MAMCHPRTEVGLAPDMLTPLLRHTDRDGPAEVGTPRPLPHALYHTSDALGSLT